MKTVHIIWHHVRHERISDDKEVAGVVLTGWEDANEIVSQLHRDDPDAGSYPTRNYWKEEIDVLTLAIVRGSKHD